MRSRAEARVALVLDGAGRAGTERHIRGLLEGLPPMGWRPILVTSRAGPLVDDAAALGVAHRLCPRWSRVGYLRALRQVLRELRPELLHAHSGRLACLAARMAGVPGVIETRHGLPERLRGLYRAIPSTARWEGRKCSLADVTICVCRADADWLVEKGGLSARRVRVVPNGVVFRDSASALASRADRVEAARRALGLPARARLVGMVGRLVPQKAPERLLLLLEAWVEAGVEGVFGGGGPLEGPLREAAARRGLASRLHWLGERDDGREVVAALDLLLLPSVWEGLPYVALEALAEGTPTLATPVGGLPELFASDGLAGSILPWDPAAWERAARSLVDDSRRRDEWTRAALRRAQEYPEAETVARVASIYRSVARS